MAGAVAAAPAHAQKTDVVVLRNGDRLTGEITELARGRLSFKTDDIGTLAIEWDNVRSLRAEGAFEVNDVQGGQYLGTLHPGASDGELRVVTNAGEVALTAPRVVRIQRVKTTFWRRLDGSLDVGGGYTSASELSELHVTARVEFNRFRHRYSLDGDSTMTWQPDADETRRNQMALGYERRLPSRFFAFALSRLEQNTELGFDLRGSLTAGAGRYLMQSARQDFFVAVGPSVNREKPLEGESTTNLEAALGLRYSRFLYDFPKVNVDVSLLGFASLSDWGRTRLELSATVKRELLKDFTVSLRGYESYDSRPATEGAGNNDYGVSFGLGWTF